MELSPPLWNFSHPEQPLDPPNFITPNCSHDTNYESDCATQIRIESSLLVACARNRLWIQMCFHTGWLRRNETQLRHWDAFDKGKERDALRSQSSYYFWAAANNGGQCTLSICIQLERRRFHASCAPAIEKLWMRMNNAICVFLRASLCALF